MDDRASRMTDGTALTASEATVAARASMVLQIIAVLSVLILTLALVPWLRGAQIPAVQAVGSVSAVLFSLAAVAFLRLGRMRLGVLSLVGVVWMHVGWGMLWLGLRYSLVGTRFAVLPFALVALLLGRRDLWATFAAFATAAAVGAARDVGWIGRGTHLPMLTPTQPLLSTVLLLLFAALLLDRLAGALRQALGEALRGNQALREREQMLEQVRQGQKMEAIGRLAGGVAHDFNNILGLILGSAEMARDALPPEHPAAPDLQHIERDVGRAKELVRQLMAFARKQVVAPKLVAVDAVVSDMLKMLERVLGKIIIVDARLGAGETTILIDRGQLEQVLLNLAVNARDAMPSGGHLYVRTEITTPPGGNPQVLLSVCDEGMGIPSDVLPHIFEPFFTTKSEGQGTGLGLATCHGIVTQAGGQIDVHSTPGKGTCFEVRFPVALSAA
jgi:signal transduction histidine kinase